MKERADSVMVILQHQDGRLTYVMGHLEQGEDGVVVHPLKSDGAVDKTMMISFSNSGEVRVEGFANRDLGLVDISFEYQVPRWLKKR